MQEVKFQISINPRIYCGFLLAVAIAFVTIHCVISYLTNEVEEIPWLIEQLFHLDEENNLPTWFSSFLLLNCAFVLYLVARAKRQKYSIQWFILSLGFFVLSIDEVAGMHESVNTAIDMNWAIPGGILVLVVGVAFVPFLLSLPRRLAALFVLSGIIYVAGAIGVELLSEDMEEESFAYGLATALEEGMEMLGAWLFLLVNLNEMKRDQVVSVETSIN